MINGSVLDIFKVGIGPSSSHTVGPMRAASAVRRRLVDSPDTTQLRIELYGSLALTGKGHATDSALMYGLLGYEPESIDIEEASFAVEILRHTGTIDLNGHVVRFSPEKDIHWLGTRTLSQHPNGMTFYFEGSDGTSSLTFFSVGGGAVKIDGEDGEDGEDRAKRAGIQLPFPYDSMSEAVAIAEANHLSLAEMAFQNECAVSSSSQVQSQLAIVWHEMNACIARGLQGEGTLPGGLEVQRRAKKLYEKLMAAARSSQLQNRSDLASVYAIAVNEENAAGRRIVTAPTNGAAGVVPAVLRYFCDGKSSHTENDIREFLLTAAVVGDVVRRRASISGAEVGCQGEVGTACAMAAAGLAAVSGATNKQIEAAAEIALEHHLGMSCDPVRGLVQVPCIERNSMGAVKAVHSCSLALNGDGQSVVRFDEAVDAMRETGRDMHQRYKETALGGLATKVVRIHKRSR